MTPGMEALEEKVARAICVAEGVNPDAVTPWLPDEENTVQWHWRRPEARAAILATLEGLMEPTEGMVEAGKDAEENSIHLYSCNDAFRAMIAAAQKEMEG